MFAGSTVARVEAAKFLELFHTPGPSSARARGLAGSGAECRLYRHGSRVWNASTDGRVSFRGSPRPRPPLLPETALSPPPESITTAGPRCPRLPGARPPPLPTSLRTETKPTGRLPHSPGVVSEESCGPRLACELQLLTHSISEDSGRCPCRSRAPQPGPGSSRCAESFFFLHNFFKAFQEHGEILSCPSPYPVRHHSLPKPTAR